MVHRGCAWVILWTTLVLPLLLLLSFYTDWWSGGETHGFTGAVLINGHKSLTAFHLHPTKLEVYTKLEGLHQTGWFIQNWRVYTKLEGLHKPGNWRVYTKLEGLPKPVAFIAAVKMTRVTAFNLCPTKPEGLHKPVAVIAAVSNGKSHSPHSTSAPQNWRVYTVTSGRPCCSHFCTSPAITD